MLDFTSNTCLINFRENVSFLTSHNSYMIRIQTRDFERRKIEIFKNKLILLTL